MKGRSIVTRILCAAATVALGVSLATVITPDEAVAKKKKKVPEDFAMTETGDQPPVMFKHRELHAVKVEKCTVCHTKIFKMKRGKTAKKKGPLTMKAMEEGQFCGTCHNGEKEMFSVKDEESCAKCHVKQ